LPLPQSLTEHYQRLGSTLVRDFGLRGLFGVDCVVRDDVPWPVEINPRYTASMEIIEWSQGQSLLARHAGVFGCKTPAPLGPEPEVGLLAKAVLFASEAMEFPQEGPWCETLARPWQPWAMPDFADIPAAGRQFQPGEPIMTLFGKGKTIDECTDRLRQRAACFRVSECGKWSPL
jgi:predicted ATP-grasp superfamily ATP-dependent carboligase